MNQEIDMKNTLTIDESSFPSSTLPLILQTSRRACSAKPPTFISFKASTKRSLHFRNQKIQ